jgi:hypothetical protein
VVFVNEIVAVEHVDTIVGSVSCNDCHLLVLTEKNNVLECFLLVGENRTAATGAREDLKVDKVDVDRVGPSAAGVLELPNLNGATLRLSQDAVLYIGEGDTVDSPCATRFAELEASVDTALHWWEGNIAERRWKVTVVGCVLHVFADDKLHDLVGSGVVLIVLNIATILESDILSGELSKVEDDFPALSHRDFEVAALHRLCQQTSVRTDDVEVDCLAINLESELECSADSSIEEPEAVLAGLHLVKGPRLSIDVDDIAKERVGLILGIEESAVTVVLLRGQSKRQVIVALRQAESILSRVVKDVEASLAEVGILGSVMSSVVVIPQSASALVVRVV